MTRWGFFLRKSLILTVRRHSPLATISRTSWVYTPVSSCKNRLSKFQWKVQYLHEWRLTIILTCTVQSKQKFFFYIPTEKEDKVTLGEKSDERTLRFTLVWMCIIKVGEVPGLRRVNLFDTTTNHFQAYGTGQRLFIWFFFNSNFNLTLSRGVKKLMFVNIPYILHVYLITVFGKVKTKGKKLVQCPHVWKKIMWNIAKSHLISFEMSRHTAFEGV